MTVARKVAQGRGTCVWSNWLLMSIFHNRIFVAFHIIIAVLIIVELGKPALLRKLNFSNIVAI